MDLVKDGVVKTADEEAAATASVGDSVARLLRPRSIAIVGASSSPGSAGAGVLANLLRFNFSGDIHLINPNRPEVEGRPCLRSVSDLPMGVDCAVLAVPNTAVVEAVADCARRGVRSVIIYSAGFVEAGAEGRAMQDEITRIARAHGMAVEGPNCMGLINYVDGIPLTFGATFPFSLEGRPGVAVLTQSGGMAAVLRAALQARGIGISFSISTGNEAVNGTEDFLEYLIDDDTTGAIAMMAEQFRDPKRFLFLARRAREARKPIVLLHLGRTDAARLSVQTHTGAMAGNFEVMRALVAHEGVAIIDTLEELIDLSELFMRCPSLPRRGAAVISDSGAFKALCLDCAETVGLALPPLSPATEQELRAALPDFIPATNPLDITAHVLVHPELNLKTMAPLLADERYGSLVLVIMIPNAAVSRRRVPPILNVLKELRPTKPVIFAMCGEEAEMDPHLLAELRGLGVPFFRSPERALRALARMTEFASRSLPPSTEAMPRPADAVGPFPSGVVPEYAAKRFLAQAGIRVPRGELVRDLPSALATAGRIGYPVAIKAQSAALSHKSDSGGVILRIKDADGLAAAWAKLHSDLARARPGLVLDGVLVEAMAPPGLELILGARNDPQWGPVLMVGLGGVWAEAMRDVRLLPPDLAPDEIARELGKLKGAALLHGFRGAPALDVEAMAQMTSRLGALVRNTPQIVEIDMNPVILWPKGEGAMAVDALMATC